MGRADLIGRRSDAVADHHLVMRAIEADVDENLDLLVPVERAWQPADRVSVTWPVDDAVLVAAQD